MFGPKGEVMLNEELQNIIFNLPLKN